MRRTLAALVVSVAVAHAQPPANPPPLPIPPRGGKPAPQPQPQPQPKPGGPRLVAVAEAKLICEGLISPNFRGVEKALTQQPADDAWAFARGQALLVAEGGNLHMLRPPQNQGQEAWMERCTDLRDTGVRLAQHAAAKDLERARLTAVDLAASCTRCHTAFRVPVQIKAFADPAP